MPEIWFSDSVVCLQIQCSRNNVMRFVALHHHFFPLPENVIPYIIILSAVYCPPSPHVVNTTGAFLSQKSQTIHSLEMQNRLPFGTQTEPTTT